MNDDAVAVSVMIVIFGLIFVIIIGVLAMQIFFLLTLHRCMGKISKENRTMEPGLVWLNLVPMLNLGWIFYTVIKIKESLEKEFDSRNLQGDGDFGYKIGLTYAILGCCSAVPYVGVLPAMVSLVFWIMYWVKIAGFSQQLDTEDDFVEVEEIEESQEFYDVKSVD